MIGILVIGYVVLGALTAAIYMQQFRDGFGDLDPDEFAVSLLFGAIWPIMLPGFFLYKLVEHR